MTGSSWAPGDRLAAAALAVAELAGTGAPWRETAEVAGVRVLRLGVDAPWATQAYLFDEPRAEAVAAALAWMRARAPSWVLTLRERWARHPVVTGNGLMPVAALPVLAVRSGEARVTPGRSGLVVEPPVDREEFVEAYAAGFEMPRSVSERLVAEPDLVNPMYTHLVGRLGGEVVGTAMVRRAGGSACVSAVGVRPEYRRRGHGAALAAAATRQALGASELAWLHATAASREVYARLGYRQVDTHLQLSAPANTVHS